MSLGQLGDPDALDALTNALHDDSALVEMWAATALGQIGDTDAVPAPVQQLEPENKHVRRFAPEALAKRGGPGVIEALEVARSLERRFFVDATREGLRRAKRRR